MGGEPWFPAKDVCEALSLGSPTASVQLACVPEEYQHVKKSNLNSIQTGFLNRVMLCVNES